MKLSIAGADHRKSTGGDENAPRDAEQEEEEPQVGADTSYFAKM